MAEKDIDNAQAFDQASYETPYQIEPVIPDSATDQKETYYVNEKFYDYLGYYKTVPDIKNCVDILANWVLGNGYKTIPLTELALLQLDGIGKEHFLEILKNMYKLAKIGGDSFAEIILDKKGKLIGLKVLDPGVVRIVANRKGRIIRYDILSKIGKNGLVKDMLTPDKVFHFMSDRIADEIHGESRIRAVEDIVIARQEAMENYRIMLRRFVKPMKIWEVAEDDPTKLAALQAKLDDAYAKCENVLVPEGTIKPPVLSSVPPNSTLNPLPWIEHLNHIFYQSFGVPMILAGGSQEITEAAGKVTFLGFEQTARGEIKYVEEQVLAQLNLEIKLEFPVTIQNELLSDQSKDGGMQASTPEDTGVAGVPLQGGVGGNYV